MRLSKLWFRGKLHLFFTLVNWLALWHITLRVDTTLKMWHICSKCENKKRERKGEKKMKPFYNEIFETQVSIFLFKHDAVRVDRDRSLPYWIICWLVTSRWIWNSVDCASETLRWICCTVPSLIFRMWNQVKNNVFNVSNHSNVLWIETLIEVVPKYHT